MARRLVCAIVFVLLALPSTLLADGFIIVRNPQRVPGHFPFAPLEVISHRVTVEITDTLAVTSVDESFYNPGGARTEGTYIFPLPAGAHIDKFAMDINGHSETAELLPADKARSIYEEIVRKMRDPALLEYVGRDAFKVRVFPIEPHETKHIQIRYTQVLKEDAGLVEYVYPLNTEKFSSKPIADVSVSVRLSSDRPLKSIYCPSHSTEIRRDGPNRATVAYHESGARPDTDFKVLFSRESKDVGVQLLTCKRAGEDEGYFMLMASPGFGSEKLKPSPKDIAFVIDTSGSMSGAKIQQARKALTYCLDNLNPDDRFDVIRFSTEPEDYFGALQSADQSHVDQALKFVEGLKARGGTAIDDALAAALRLRRGSDRPFIVVFLTDGAPTVGETREDRIVRRATERASDARIFCFGIGNDVNTHLLDRLADATRAASQYVLPEEDIEVKVSSFYDKIKDPILTNVAVSISGVHASQLYPGKLPDMFKGDTLLMFGRYGGSGNGAVKITGDMEGKPQTYAEDVSFTDSDASRDYIATMWATRRVGWLLDEIRMHGESAELKDEVVKLSREHGIVTPYTAYLIMEDESKRKVPELSRTFQEMEKDAVVQQRSRDSYLSTVKESDTVEARAGKQAVANAQAYGAMKNADNLDLRGASGGSLTKSVPAATAAPAAPAQTGYRYAQNYNQQSRMINGRAFYQNGNIWSDSSAQSRKLAQKNVKFNSDDYFALLREHPDAAQWLSLGSNVDVVVGDTLYSIRED